MPLTPTCNTNTVSPTCSASNRGSHGLAVALVVPRLCANCLICVCAQAAELRANEAEAKLLKFKSDTGIHNCVALALDVFLIESV